MFYSQAMVRKFYSLFPIRPFYGFRARPEQYSLPLEMDFSD